MWRSYNQRLDIEMCGLYSNLTIILTTFITSFKAQAIEIGYEHMLSFKTVLHLILRKERVSSWQLWRILMQYDVSYPQNFN